MAAEARGGAGDGGIGRHTRTMSGLTLVSRVLGLVRDLVTVRIFGDTVAGSAFAAAFAVPNMFRRLFGEGAFSAAFLPVYARMSDDEPERAGALASLTVAVLALITGGILAVVELGLLLVILLAPGDADRVYSLGLVMVMLPFMPLICVAAVLGGMLQCHGRFGVWAAAPILMNVLVIAVSAPYFVVEGAGARDWAVYIGIAAVVSGALQVVWSVRALRGRVAWSRGWGRVRGEGRAMLGRMAPVLVGLGTLQLNALTDTVIAMYPNWVGPTVGGLEYPLDGSSNALLFYAQRLYQFPLGVFGIAVATAAFPALSRAAGDREAFGAMLARGARLSLFVGVPASVGLIVVARPLVSLLYGAGAGGFSDEGVARASWVLIPYAGAVWAYALNQLLTRGFYARGDTRTPMRIALAMVGLNLVLNLVLIWPLREAGLALSTAVCAVLQCLLLVRASGRIGRIGGLGIAAARVAARSVVVGAAAWGAMRLADAAGADIGAWGDAARVGSAVLAGAGVYLGLAWWARAPELWWLVARSTDSGEDAGGGRPEESDG